MKTDQFFSNKYLTVQNLRYGIVKKYLCQKFSHLFHIILKLSDGSCEKNVGVVRWELKDYF